MFVSHENAKHDERLNTFFKGKIALESAVCLTRDYKAQYVKTESHGKHYIFALDFRYRVRDATTGEEFEVHDDFATFRWLDVYQSFVVREAKELKRDGYAVIDYDRGYIFWNFLDKKRPQEMVEILAIADFVPTHFRTIIAHDEELLKRDYIFLGGDVTIKKLPSFFNRDPF